MAEAVGFEPTVGFPLRSVSNRVLSASQPRFRSVPFNGAGAGGQEGKACLARGGCMLWGHKIAKPCACGGAVLGKIAVLWVCSLPIAGVAIWGLGEKRGSKDAGTGLRR